MEKIEILSCIGWLFVRFKRLGFHIHQWVKQDRVVTHPRVFCLYPCSIFGLLWSFTFCLCFFFYNAFQDSNLKRNTYTRAIVSVSQSLGIHSCCVLDHHRTYVSCTAFFSATHFVKKLKMAVCNIPFERQSLFSAHTWTQPDKCTCIIKFIRRYVYLKETTLTIAIIQLIITAEILDNHLRYECMPLKNSIFEESSKETPALPQSTWRSTTAFQRSQKGEFNLSRLGYTSGIFT